MHPWTFLNNLKKVVYAFDLYQIRTASTEDRLRDILEQNTEVFEQAGFTKVLSLANRDMAVVSLKEFYGFYRYMAPMQQFAEGKYIYINFAMTQILSTFHCQLLKCSQK